jgi:hypothetical protein
MVVAHDGSRTEPALERASRSLPTVRAFTRPHPLRQRRDGQPVADALQPGGANPCNPTYAQSFGTYGIQVALADASVRTVSPNISIRTWSGVVIPNDGFALGSDW